MLICITRCLSIIQKRDSNFNISLVMAIRNQTGAVSYDCSEITALHRLVCSTSIIDRCLICNTRDSTGISSNDISLLAISLGHSECTACVKHKILYDSTVSCCSEKRLCRCGCPILETVIATIESSGICCSRCESDSCQVDISDDGSNMSRTIVLRICKECLKRSCILDDERLCEVCIIHKES